MSEQNILILDFGGQYTQLIAKAVRELGVFSEIYPHNTPIDIITNKKPHGIILSGGPESVYLPDSPKVSEEIFNLKIPILGICYGMQLIHYTFGGKMLTGDDVKEYGETVISIDNNNKLFSSLPEKIDVWMSHGDSVDKTSIQPDWQVIAHSQNHVAAIYNEEKQTYAIQFHPEVSHTPQGSDIIANFVYNICHCSSSWTMTNYIEESKKYIRDTAGTSPILAFVSGGVDSTFVAALLSETEGLGPVYVVYIEALMRKGETEEVAKIFERLNITNPIIYHAENEFINALKNVSSPEEKRKIVGNLFGDIQQKICFQLGLDETTTFLAQGTLYTDLIESGYGVGNSAHTIKSHHNVACQFIEKIKKHGNIVEPNRLIFKDEVRKAAKELNLPESIWGRQPFPGPGLAIRIVDGNTSWVDDNFLTTNEIVATIAQNHGFEGTILPIKTVGVQGDQRTYSFLTLLRGPRQWHKIREVTNKITAEVHNVNRVVFDITNTQAKINNTNIIPTTISEETVHLLQNVDDTGRYILSKGDYDISQTIFVLFASDIYNTGKRSVALRAVQSKDFMTVSPTEISWEHLDEISNTLINQYDVGAFVIDVTDKPPATTEWE